MKQSYASQARLRGGGSQRHCSHSRVRIAATSDRHLALLVFQKDSALARWYRTRTEGTSGARKTTMIVALARKLLIALMVVLNNLDRYQLALDAISRIPRIAFTSRSMAVLRENVLANHRPPMPSLPTT
jgi:hypothetical protein